MSIRMSKQQKRSAAMSAQQALFNEDQEAPSLPVVAIAAQGASANPAQRDFNKLTERIRQGRERLAGWESYGPRFHRRVSAELQPIDQEIESVQRQVVLQLHESLAAEGRDRLKGRHRSAARGLLVDILENLLEANDDPELVALYDRYSQVSHAQRSKEELELAEAILGEVLGPEVLQGHEAQNADDLMRHASERMAARETGSRKKSTGQRRESRAAQKKAQDAKEASASVRDIYRKLASALHPDREADPAEKERKTALLQRANGAYERNDLLELLTLQIEIEQIDAAGLSNVPEERLRHYNRVLRDQANALDLEVNGHCDFFRVEFDLTVREVTPEVVDKALSARIARARGALAQMRTDSKRLADPRQRRAVIEQLTEDDEQEIGLAELAMLAATLDALTPGARSRSKRGKRRRG
jgi:hypothetical protein